MVYDKLSQIPPNSPTFSNDSLVRAACQLSREINAKAIVGMTKSRIHWLSPVVSTVLKPTSLSSRLADRLLNIINLFWGLRGYYYDGTQSTDDTFADLEKILVDKGHLHPGDTYVSTASMPLHWEDRTNMMKVQIVK